MRCTKTDLPADQCAHCVGADLKIEHDWTTTNPTPPPRAVPVDLDAEPEQPFVLGGGSGPVTDLEDLYVRLHEQLPATSKGKSADNAAGYAQRPDPRRAPLRVEVLDLINRIESEIPDLATAVCDSLGVMRCVVFPADSDRGETGPSPRVLAAFDSLRRHWMGFDNTMPEMAAQVHRTLEALVRRGRRLTGQTSAPVPLATPCPSCGDPTVLQVETDDGWVAVCINPEDRDEWGDRRQWSETAWEDATSLARRVYAG